METRALSHYHDGIQNSESESSHEEVSDTADNVDRASIIIIATGHKVQTDFRVTCNKEKIEKSLCRSTASYLKLVNVWIKARFQVCVGVSAHAREFVSGHL